MVQGFIISNIKATTIIKYANLYEEKKNQILTRNDNSFPKLLVGH